MHGMTKNAAASAV